MALFGFTPQLFFFFSLVDLPDIIPLVSGGHSLKKRDHTRQKLSNKPKKKVKKLKAIRKGILSKLQLLNSPTTSSSKPQKQVKTFSSHLTGDSNITSSHLTTQQPVPCNSLTNQAGPSNAPAVWSNFNHMGPHVPCFIQTPWNGSQGPLVSDPPCASGQAPFQGSLVRQTARHQLNDNNIFNAGTSSAERTGLRPIVIDGSNVAFEYLKYADPSSGLKFNAKGIEVVVDYFKQRGHKKIYVFIPSFRAHHPNTLFPEILKKLQNEGKCL